MMWSAIRPALLGLAATLTNITDPDSIHWRGSAPAGNWRRGPRITMNIKSIRGVGNDEIRRTPVDQLSDNDVMVSGQRQITWTMTFESLSAADSDVAMLYADKVRGGLVLTSSGIALRAVGLSVASIEATQVLEFNSQAKPFTTAILDVQLNAVENLVDNSAGSGNWIQRAIVSSNELVGPDGEPVSNQMDEEITDEG